jgi:ATP-dependent Clp protease ATP-binding subunit ClpA
MKVTIPVYVEQAKGQRGMEYRVSPLFRGAPLRRAELLSRALSRLVQDLRSELEEAGREAQHDALAAWTFSPDLETATLNESLLLRHATVKCRLMVAEFSALGRRIGFSPTIPSVWFDIAEGESLKKRALDAYTAYFREEEKAGGDVTPPLPMEQFVRGHVTEIDLEIFTQQQWKRETESLLASLMGNQKMDGREELERVGRRIDSLFPEDLDRAVLREMEVGELTRMLEGADRRPVLLVGPPMAGKTALMHEYVYRRLEKLPSPYTDNDNVWLISPQRLISGMVYAGQWENRLLAILKHVREKQHVLYFDDLPGLYHAGLSASSNLSVAHVLRPYIERREVRVSAEITPEGLRVLQERDRGFADLFQVVPVREQSTEESRRVLISVVRQLEGMHGCRFGVEVLPTVMELQGRYMRERAFPGKAARFLKDLAAKYKGADVGRAETLEEFRNKSGLSVGFLDRQKTLERKEVEEGLRKELTGQARAVGAMADLVVVAKAQLNDPGRPLGTLLFLGPTGVGKTQAAKALAAYLFGSAERLLRLDMNEYVDPYSAARLVGTWGQPEGFLTGAVRRQPFSVVLLDEIEKAHPDVFDLLLQVLGEGRLTDSLGRTSDFTNAVILMTSNLGVREAGMRFGFGAAGGGAKEAYREAAKAFFRPEFFNRIDRVVPFERLTREETRGIAQRLLDDVLGREGLKQRRCMLSVSAEAMERLVDMGYTPELGARALRRAVEKQLVHPVAARLAAIEPGTPTLLAVRVRDEEIDVRVRPLVYAEREDQPLGDPEAVLDGVDAALVRLHDGVEKLRPAGRLVVGEIGTEHARYFVLKDQLEKVDRLLVRAGEGAATDSRGSRVRKPRKTRMSVKRSRLFFRELLAAGDLNQYLTEVAAGAEEPPEEGRRVEEVVREAALLEALVAGGGGRRILLLRALVGSALGAPGIVSTFYRHAGCAVKPVRKPIGRFLPVWVEHAAGEVLFGVEAGIHLVVREGQRLEPVEALAVELSPGEVAEEAAVRAMEQLERSVESEALGRVVRMYERGVTDLRSGLVTDRAEDAGCREMLLAQLPLPVEVGGG